MLTKSQIFDFLFTWLKKESGGLTVVRSPQPLNTDGTTAPRPPRPYVSLRYLSPSTRIGSSIDQQTVTGGTYPASGVWRVSLASVAAGDSLTINGVTYASTDDNVNAEIQDYITYFSTNYQNLVLILAGVGAIDVYRNDGVDLAEPSGTGAWTIAASPNQGQPLYTVSTEGMRKAVASINVYGDNAVEIMAKIRDSLDRPDVEFNFAQAGVVHIGEGNIEDLTAALETIYEERAQMDLVVGFVSSSEVDVSTIETINLVGTVLEKTFDLEVNT